jgi:hypothetical protein
MDWVVLTDVLSASTSVGAEGPILCWGGPVVGLMGNMCWVGNQVAPVRSHGAGEECDLLTDYYLGVTEGLVCSSISRGHNKGSPKESDNKSGTCKRLQTLNRSRQVRLIGTRNMAKTSKADMLPFATKP